MRYGLIGCGGIGALRAQALGLAQGVGLAAVCDAAPARARALAGKHGAAVEADWRAIRAELEYKLQPAVRTGGIIFSLDHRIVNGTPLEAYRCA